jgi:hypothetical protein
MGELRDLDERALSTLGPNCNRLTEWQKRLRADSKVIVKPLGSGTESGSRTAGLKPDKLAVIAVINNLTIVFARENVSRHLYLLSSNLAQICFAGAASHRRTTRFVALLAFHRLSVLTSLCWVELQLAYKFLNSARRLQATGRQRRSKILAFAIHETHFILCCLGLGRRFRSESELDAED